MISIYFKRLQAGDIVRAAGGGDEYVVTGNYGSRVTAARTIDLTNHDEWDLVGQVYRIQQSRNEDE